MLRNFLRELSEFFENCLLPADSEESEVECDQDHPDPPPDENSETQDATIMVLIFFIFCPFPILYASLVGILEEYFTPLHAVLCAYLMSVLLMIFFYYLSYKTKELVCRIQNRVKIFIQDVNYSGRERKCQCLILAFLLLVIAASGYWAFESDKTIMIILCLFASGFIVGILSVCAYAFWKESQESLTCFQSYEIEGDRVVQTLPNIGLGSNL